MVDFELSDDELAIQSLFGDFFEHESTIDVVRGAEPEGYSPELWEKLLGLGIRDMVALDDGASFQQIALSAIEYGRHLAPVPFVEFCVASRLSERIKSNGLSDVSWDDDPNALVTIALHDLETRPTQVVPAGALASVALGTAGGDIVAVRRGDARAEVPRNPHGSVPVAMWNVDPGILKRLPAAPTGAHTLAVEEWEVLVAAALVGLSERAIEIAAAYVSKRSAFGKIIGSFQGVAHPLADSATRTLGAKLLVHRAAWGQDQRSAGRAVESLSTMALAFTAESAADATRVATHVHGGYGASLEYDIQMFFQRAKAWCLQYEDPRRLFARIPVPTSD